MRMSSTKLSAFDCLKSGHHLMSCDTDGYCGGCGHQEANEAELFIAEFEADIVQMYGLEFLAQLPNSTVTHYLAEHEGTQEVLLYITIRVTKNGVNEECSLLVDDAPAFFNPSWEEEDQVNNLACYLNIAEEEARARLQKCGLLPDAPAIGQSSYVRGDPMTASDEPPRLPATTSAPAKCKQCESPVSLPHAAGCPGDDSIEYIRAKIDALKPENRCTPDCPTLAVFQADELTLQRCDDCWWEHPNPLYDDEVAQLPEAQTALLEEKRRAGSTGARHEQGGEVILIPKKQPEAVEKFLAKPEQSLNGIERQLRISLLVGLRQMPCPMCFEPVNLYEAGDDTQIVGRLYEGKYICPYCDTELARAVPLFMQPGTPGWHWRRKTPIPSKKNGPHALAKYYIEQAEKQGAIVERVVFPEDTIAEGPPTDRGRSERPTVPPRDSWYIASRENGRAIIRDQNVLFVAEATAEDAELVAAAPELLDLVDDLMDDRRREHRLPEALALVERLRR
jgi:hypothetical protein